MSTRFFNGHAEPHLLPILTAQEVEVGDLAGLSSAGNVVRAQDETWLGSLAATQAAFVSKFVGISAQKKLANAARAYGNSQDNRVGINTGGVYEFDCASTSFTVGQLLGPAKQSGNALESQKVVLVTGEELAVARVVEATTSSTKVLGRLLSARLPLARQRVVGGASSGTGTAAGTNVSARELGDEVCRQTVLSLASTPVTVANTTGASFGSQKLYDFPDGRILVLGVTASLGFNWAGTTIVQDGSGDFSLGTTATADATLSGTDVNLLPSTAMTDPFVAGVGAATFGALAASAHFDGTATAIDAVLNLIIDDADVADGSSAVVLATGTITISWINLGDN